METYIIIFLRIITIMLLLLFATLFIMGKRPIGELPVFDFLTIIVMGAIVGADIADPKIEHLPTAFAVVILALFQRVVSTMIVKSKRVRRLATFEPTIVVKDGRLVYRNIKKINYSIDDILMLLREKDIFNIEQLSYGIIEANGNMSVLKKPQFETVKPADMNITPNPQNIPLAVVIDGKPQASNIKKLELTEEDIVRILTDKGYGSLREVFFATLDNQGNINISAYDSFNECF